MNPGKSDYAPPAVSWEMTLRGHLMTLCLAAQVGKPGDMQTAADIIVEFCRTLAGSDT